MRIRTSIFDSASEREAFKAIAARWSDRALLAYGLPLRKILAAEEQDALEPNVERYLNNPQTSVDYTFADREAGRPLLSIEFDGLGHGHSRGSAYVGQPTPIDRNRGWKLDTKLRLARAARFPLLVVSYEEVRPLEEGDELVGARRAADEVDDDVLRPGHLAEPVSVVLGEVRRFAGLRSVAAGPGLHRCARPPAVHPTGPRDTGAL